MIRLDFPVLAADHWIQVDWKYPVGEMTSENSGVFCFLWETFYPSTIEKGNATPVGFSVSQASKSCLFLKAFSERQIASVTSTKSLELVRNLPKFGNPVIPVYKPRCRLLERYAYVFADIGDLFVPAAFRLPLAYPKKSLITNRYCC